MTKQQIEKFVDQMSADQLKSLVILMYGLIETALLILTPLPGKGSQGKP